MTPGRRRLTFGELELDLHGYELTRVGRPVSMQPKALDALVLMARQPGRLFTREELLDGLWPEAVVEDGSLTQLVSRIRRAVGPGVIETVPRRGYRFVAPVQEVRAQHPVEDPDLVGRVQEVQTVRDLLDERRLVVLTGMGGVGKTRVAEHLARTSADDWPGGVRMCDATAAVDASSLLGCVSRALEGRELRRLALDAERGRLVRIAGELGRVLIVVDNLEHLEAIASTELAPLLEGTDELHILATSRVPLRVPGAREVHLEPLDPELGLALLRQRIDAVRHGASDRLDPDAMRALVERLGGVPLALELAAARLSVLTPQTLLERLSRSLGVIAREGSDRHGSLEAVLDASWQLLSASERELLAALSVFRGGFDLDSVEAVVGERRIVERLERLVAHALVRRVSSHGRTRLTMLETVRQYAWGHLERSGRRPGLEARHAAHVAELLEGAEDWLPDDRPGRLDAERANVLIALRRVGHDDALFVRLVWGVAFFASGALVASQIEALTDAAVARSCGLAPELRVRARLARAWCRWNTHGDGVLDDLLEARTLTRSHTALRARVALLLGCTLSVSGAFEPAVAHLHEALAIFTTRTEREWVARTRVALARTRSMQSQYATADRLFVEARASAVEARSRALEAAALVSHAWVLQCLGRTVEQRRALKRAIELHPDSGSAAMAWFRLGCLDALDRDHDAAEAKLRRALALRRRVGGSVVLPLERLASVSLDRGDIPEARSWIEQALDEASRYTTFSRALALQASVVVALAEGDLDRARREASAADRLASEHGHRHLAAAAAAQRCVVACLSGDPDAARRARVQHNARIEGLNSPEACIYADLLWAFTAALGNRRGDALRAWQAVVHPAPSRPTWLSATPRFRVYLDALERLLGTTLTSPEELF